jgi:hypothetical protein
MEMTRRAFGVWKRYEPLAQQAPVKGPDLYKDAAFCGLDCGLENVSFQLEDVSPHLFHLQAWILSGLPVTRPEPRIDLEIQLLRLVQLALNGADIVTQRSEEVRHQGSGLTSIGDIRFAELGTHPLFLHAELDPERQEDENENEEPAHLGDGNRHAKENVRMPV